MTTVFFLCRGGHWILAPRSDSDLNCGSNPHSGSGPTATNLLESWEPYRGIYAWLRTVDWRGGVPGARQVSLWSIRVKTHGGWDEVYDSMTLVDSAPENQLTKPCALTRALAYKCRVLKGPHQPNQPPQKQPCFRNEVEIRHFFTLFEGPTEVPSRKVHSVPFDNPPCEAGRIKVGQAS